MKKEIFWTPEHQRLIEEYYWCYTASTSAITRNNIYNKLYSTFNEIIDRAIVTTNLHFNKEQNEVKQVAHIHIYSKLLNRLKPELLRGAQQFLYKSIRNYLITYFYISPTRSNRIQFNMDYDVDYYNDNCSIEADDELIREDTKKEIISHLNMKIRKKKTLNNTYSIYLQLLREYLLDNDFDERGVKEYIMQKMRIKSNTFNTISSQLGIKVTTFSAKDLPNDDEF